MAWKDTRGSTRSVITTTRSMVHADDAKSRTDDAHSAARRGFPRKLLIGGAVLALVVVGGVVAVFALNGDDSPTSAGRAVAVVPTPSVSPVAEEPTPEDVLAESLPTGLWRAQIVGRSKVLRDGTTQPFDYHEKATRWTFASDACTAHVCTGTVSSTSGSDFDYTWNGRKLVVVREGLTSTSDKAACVDTETGEPVPITEAAARDTFDYAFSPFTGSATSMTSKLVIQVSTEYFGTCKPTPKDTVRFLEEQVITQLQKS
jgi:serine/threonine-protein kinase